MSRIKIKNFGPLKETASVTDEEVDRYKESNRFYG